MGDIMRNTEAFNSEDILSSVTKTNFSNKSIVLKEIEKDLNISVRNGGNVLNKTKKGEPEDKSNKDELFRYQYKNKENLIPVYESISDIIKSFGYDINTEIKKAYISFKRKKQFAVIQPSAKSRIDIGLILKNIPPQGILDLAGTFNSKCTHRIRIGSVNDINEDVIKWLRKAYEKAG